MAAIETTKLSKRYGKVRGLEELTLRVEEGDFFGFIGPNGAGKSTTIRMLLGLIAPTSGSAKVLGQTVDLKERSFLREVGYMPSETAFYDSMRVRDVIRFSAQLRGMDCTAEAQSLCQCLALDTSRKVRELSLGNRKKVGIVCALQHRPRLYIFDEPTSGLDPLVQRTFFSLLKERSAHGATVFFSSHVLAEIQHHCNRAAMVKDGRLIACDRVEQLMQDAARQVTVRGITSLPEGIQGKSPVLRPDGLSFLYQGNMRALLRALGELPVEDVTIAEPELEQVFMHYYEGEEQP